MISSYHFILMQNMNLFHLIFVGVVLAGNSDCNRPFLSVKKEPRILSSLLLSLVDQDTLLLLAVYEDPAETFDIAQQETEITKTVVVQSVTVFQFVTDAILS